MSAMKLEPMSPCRWHSKFRKYNACTMGFKLVLNYLTCVVVPVVDYCTSVWVSKITNAVIRFTREL